MEKNVSIGTLIEVERWVRRVQIGKARGTFGPILFQIKENEDDLYETIHASTLAQIMPYKEIVWKLRMRNFSFPKESNKEFIEDLAEEYRVTHKDAVTRVRHVLAIYKYKEQLKEIAKEQKA